jgi:hypothetical protein
MSRARPLIGTIATAAIVALPPRATAQDYIVQLKKAWVNKFADRATIEATMKVRHAHKSANTIGADGDDGDMHFSGESADIGLPFVAEIVNAALPGEQAADAAMKAKEGSSTPLVVTGAWRLWFEHPSKSQTQGAQNPFLPNNTNPDHSFEIHPISRVDQNDVGKSFVPIKGYTAYTADVAFPYFDKCTLTVKASQSGISLRSKKLKYNYVGFHVELTHAPKKVSDGYIALAKVLSGDTDEEAANGERRMIFVDGTPAADKIKGASNGDRFRVLGVPRVNLNAILALVKKHGSAQFDAPLPYEMIIVAVEPTPP